ncbi:MAG: alanine--tRNA ligase-related protein [Candidatus Gottesmanbacteria bacterium]|nr:alanine--tRNA ligase-related protein [Candidatus Gottesmanbacteria bacterium]
MRSADLRKKYIEFFKARGHVEIPSAPLVPENDPTTLFTSSGMQPLIPYLLGQKHPLGKRLVNSQRSFRAADINEVGDTCHTTFFEMLGNWSLGDYFKQEQLPWILEFLTQGLKLQKDKLFHIFYYGVDKNWWSRSGEPASMPSGEPGGPDSEVFYDFGPSASSGQVHECHPNCQCGRFMEIANSVFMQYQKMGDGSLKELSQKNVDFGGGLERLVAVTEKTPDVFKTDLFIPMITILEHVSGKTYGSVEAETRAMRIIADHIKGAVMMMADGVLPSNKAQGYMLRRLIRRSLLYGRKLGLLKDLTYIVKLVEPVAAIYESAYPAVVEKAAEIKLLLQEEALRFGKTLERGLSEFEKATDSELNNLFAFNLFQTYGFPLEITEELYKQKGKTVDKKNFEHIFQAHQALSRRAAKGMFAGGLADHSKQTSRLHSAHHLLLAALQKIVDSTIHQRGSNITVERLRMDFNFTRKVTLEELKKVEELVNGKIKEDVKVERVEMPREEAEKVGAQMEFGHKYPDRVSVYFMGPRDHYFSAEFCGGPHVTHTGEIGHFKILKEESAGSGIRRIYAALSTP